MVKNFFSFWIFFCYIMVMDFFSDVTPEFDTVRVYFPPFDKWGEVIIDLENFFYKEFKNQVASFDRVTDDQGNFLNDEFGEPLTSLVWEKKRLDMKNSWWSKMQIFESRYLDFPCIGIEFSVAKWHNKTNGINRGCPLFWLDILSPCLLQLKSLNLLKYSIFESWGSLCGFLLDNCVLRRLDLSYNFLVNDVGTCMRMLSTCRLNNHDSSKFQAKLNLEELADKNKMVSLHDIGEFAQTIGSNETVSFGGSRGCLYKAMFYDKAKEQKRLYSLRDISNTKEEWEHKKQFYKDHVNLLKNVVRFEVQYNSKFFLSKFVNYKTVRGIKIMDNIINLCENHWVTLLRCFDQQLQSENVRTEKEYSVINQAIEKLESIRSHGGISDTKFNNLCGFIIDCSKNQWHNVWNRLGKVNFGIKYREVKKLTGLDVKREMLSNLPIMRVMPTDLFDYHQEHSIYFKSGHSRSFIDETPFLVSVC